MASGVFVLVLLAAGLRGASWIVSTMGRTIKIMPAPIAMVLLLPLGLPTARRFVAGITIGLVPIMVFATLDPSAFFNNVALFNIVRPSSPASLWSGMPSTVIWLLRIGFVGTFLATAAAAVIRDLSIDRRMTAYVVLTIVVLLTSQTNFDNYWLWWIPPYLTLLCAGWMRPSSEISRDGVDGP